MNRREAAAKIRIVACRLFNDEPIGSTFERLLRECCEIRKLAFDPKFEEFDWVWVTSVIHFTVTQKFDKVVFAEDPDQLNRRILEVVELFWEELDYIERNVVEFFK